MYWKLSRVERGDAPESADLPAEGRFVLHRHQDTQGPHLDLRLEQAGYLAGWRIVGTALEEGAWATEKMPHPLYWLDRDGEAVREDAGVYVWHSREADGAELELRGGSGALRLRLEAAPGLPVESVQAIRNTLTEHGIAPEGAAALVTDGVTARQRAIERLCGLGRELEGAAFPEDFWRQTLRGLCLRDIHRQLETFEGRFDAKYPPQPVSRMETLPEEKGAADCGRALNILFD
jgi:hypothetical protein